jgi:uncharacterized membrane protein YoaK (UPF0700 family)
MPPAITATHLRHSVVLSFIAAFVDTYGYIGLFGVFTAHVTGNFVLIGAALVYGRGDLLARLLVLPLFLLAVAATYLCGRWLARRQIGLAAPALLVEALLLIAAVLLTLVDGAMIDSGAPLTIIAALLLAAAMGVQNALNRLCFAGMAPSTVMTGNVTQVMIDLMMMLTSPPGAEREQARQRFARLWPLIAAFALGAAAGAIGFAWVGFCSLLLPAAGCVVLAARQPRGL